MIKFSDYAQEYIFRLQKVLTGIQHEQVEQFVDLLLEARASDRNIFFVGNGGSAATSSHFANDFGIGTRQRNKPFRAVSLTDNLATITALGNDFGYDQIFSRQIEILGRADDLLVAISASGNSENLICAFETAKNLRLTTVAITAFDGGALREMADYSVHVPTSKGEYGPAEDAHMILDHLITNYLMTNLEYK